MTDPACNGRDRSKASAAEPNVPRARVRAAYPSSYSAPASSKVPVESRADEEKEALLLRALVAEGVSHARQELKDWGFLRLAHGAWCLWVKRSRHEQVDHGGAYIMRVVLNHQHRRVGAREDLSFLDDWESGPPGTHLVK